MSDDDLTTFRLRLKGEVQGVGFRQWAIAEANTRKLNGWVRNRGDGSLEILISGPYSAVQDMLKACARGPEEAQVAKIDITREDTAPAAGFKRQATL